MLRHTALLAFLAILIGCEFENLDPGGGAVSSAVVAVRPGVTDEIPICGDCVEPDRELPPGTLTGRIVLDGVLSALPDLIARGESVVDPTLCAADHAIPDQSMLVGADAGIANVFVYVAKPPKGWDPESYVKPKDVVLDQLGCIFAPHAAIWPTRVPIVIKNSDGVSHNVLIQTNRNGIPNTTSPPRSEDRLIWMKREPVPIQIKCAIHPWMSSYTLITDHPFAALTDSEGRFEFPELPAGEHTLRIWHERGGLLDARLKVNVKPGPEKTTLNLKYPIDEFDF